MIHITTRGIDRMVADWRAAALVDDRTAAMILAHEAALERSGGVRGHLPGLLVLLGGLAVALGLAALVSANWNAIPVAVKLGTHLLLTAGLGIAAWTRLDHGAGGRRDSLAREALLILLSASTLALIAHVGQSFNLQGSETGLIGFWLLLVTPFTLAYARSDVHRWLWTAGAVGLLFLVLEDHAGALEEMGLLTTALVLPVLAAYAAPLAARYDLLDAGWARHLRRIAVGAVVIAASLSSLLWYADGPDAEMRGLLPDLLLGLVLAAAGFLAIAGAEARLRDHAALVLAASPLWALLPCLWVAFLPGPGSMWPAAAGFGLYWLVIAVLALEVGAVGIFRLAALLIAGRLFVVFLEAAGGLLATGAGLVVAGLLLIGFGYGTRSLVRWVERRHGPATAGGEG